MLVTKSRNYHDHAPSHELCDEISTPFPEVPERIDAILDACVKLGLQIETIQEPIDIKKILALHSPRYLKYFRKKCDELAQKHIAEMIPSEACNDTHSPLTSHTYEVAVEAANVAISSAGYLLKQKDDLIYALCRPPGHHADYRTMGGSCYLNNAALAANVLASHGKVAILDIDYHHGNGTQEFFYDRDDVLFVSIHTDPDSGYPFTTGFADEKGIRQGRGYNLNLPLPCRASEQQYLKALRTALGRVRDYNPQFIVLSLGYDTYKDDPLGAFSLEVDSYHAIGLLIAKARGNTPMLIVQEGGYVIDKLSSMTENFIHGLSVASE